jgi:hypothetical protein
LVSAGGVTALVVALGRLWTKSYYDTFGLPTSDLQLTTEDYAFRAKEALIMVTIAAVASFAVWWLYRAQASDDTKGSTSVEPEDAEHSANTNNAPERSSTSAPSSGEADSPSPANTAADRRTGTKAGMVVAGVTVGLLLLFLATQVWSMLVETPPGAIEWLTTHWSLTANVIAFPIGIAGGFLMIWITTASVVRRRRVVAFLVVIAVITVYLPFAVVRLAQASALQAMQTRRLAHAVIEFTDEAPAAIQSGDDPSRSVRVYVVLLTPDRLAVAFPYPCTHVTTARSSDIPLDDIDLSKAPAGSTVCDTVVFDRDQVESVRILGKGDRPSNDEPDQADLVELAANPVNGEVRAQTVFQQAFDFAKARPLSVTCQPSPGGASNHDGKTRRQGVWVRLAPSDPGWVSVEGSPGHMLRKPVSNPGCQFDSPERFQVTAGEEQLVYLYALEDDPDLDVRTVTIRYTPLTTVVELTEASLLRVAVEVEAAKDPCNGDGPTIAAPGVGHEHAECEHDPMADTATYHFEPQQGPLGTPQQVPPGIWRVVICTGHENVTALRAMATPVQGVADPTQQVGTPSDNVAQPGEEGDADTEKQGRPEDHAEEKHITALTVACTHYND